MAHELARSVTRIQHWWQRHLARPARCWMSSRSSGSIGLEHHHHGCPNPNAPAAQQGDSVTHPVCSTIDKLHDRQWTSLGVVRSRRQYTAEAIRWSACDGVACARASDPAAGALWHASWVYVVASRANCSECTYADGV